MNLDKLKESARKYEQSGQWRQAIDVYKKALREFEEVLKQQSTNAVAQKYVASLRQRPAQ